MNNSFDKRYTGLLSYIGAAICFVLSLFITWFIVDTLVEIFNGYESPPESLGNEVLYIFLFMSACVVIILSFACKHLINIGKKYRKYE